MVDNRPDTVMIDTTDNNRNVDNSNSAAHGADHDETMAAGRDPQNDPVPFVPSNEEEEKKEIDAPLF